jgi:hypothetical protein
MLLRGQYTAFASDQLAQRHDLLQEALRTGFEKLTAGSLEGPKALTAAFGPEVRQGRLMFWTDHPGDQPLLTGLGLGGAFPQAGRGSDLLSVDIANAANNKIDAYLQERVADQVSYDPGSGQVRSTVTLTFDNTAPSSGLPPNVIGSHAGSGLPSGTNYMWVSVYSPLDLDSATLAGQPFGLSAGVPELGVKAYSGFLPVPSGATVTLTLSLTGRVSSGPAYRMALRLQPLALTPTMSVSVTPTAGWGSPASSPGSWTANADAVETHTWAFVGHHGP